MRDQIVIVGSMNQDLVLNLHRFPGPGETVAGHSIRMFSGGKGANQAFAVARLGGRSTMIGQVGDDAAGDAQLASLRSVDSDVRHVRRARGELTGTAVIIVEENGNNRIIAVPGANGSFTSKDVEQVRQVLIASAALLVLLEVQLATETRATELAHGAGVRVILDPAPAQALPDEILSRVEYLTPNLPELADLTGDALSDDASEESVVHSARKLCARGVRTVIAKLGARGAMIVSAESFSAVPAFTVNVVDTTGAGDCFTAAFVTALVAGASERSACRFAAAAAAISVTRPGAQPSMPSRDDVLSMLASSDLNDEEDCS